MSTNHKPKTDATDDAFWGRTVLIPFTLKFTDTPLKPNERKVDRAIKDRIVANESSKVFRILVEGCLEWQQRGLDVPACLLDATAEYRQDQDLIGRWLADRAVMGENFVTQSKVAYDDFMEWREAGGIGGQFQMRTFGDLLTKKFEKKHINGGRIGYIGFGLRTDDYTPPKEDDLSLTLRALRLANDGDILSALEIASRIGDAEARATVRTSVEAIGIPQEMEMGDSLIQNLQRRKALV